MKIDTVILILLINVVSIIIPHLPFIKRKIGDNSILDGIVNCGICLNFILGSIILSFFGQPTKSIFGIDSFFNIIFDGLICTFFLVIIGLTGDLMKKIFNFIYNIIIKFKR